MTTFSKFAASAGAAISSHSRELIDLLDVSPTSIGTISLPAPTTAAALEAIRQVRQNPQLVQRLQDNTRYLRSLLRKHEFETRGETQVIPVFLPPELNPKLFASELIEKHRIWVSPVWYRATPRLRITVNALHSSEEIDHLVAAMLAIQNALSNRIKAN